MTETGKVFLRYLYKRFGWKVIHHRKKLFRIIHKRAFETSMKKLKFVIFTNAPCKGLNSNNLSFDAGLLLFKEFLFKIGAVKLINRIVYWSSLIFIINCSAGFEKT